MLCKEELEGVKLLWDTLDVVEPINTDDNLDAPKSLFQLGDTILNALLFQVLIEACQ